MSCSDPQPSGCPQPSFQGGRDEDELGAPMHGTHHYPFHAIMQFPNPTLVYHDLLVSRGPMTFTA